MTKAEKEELEYLRSCLGKFIGSEYQRTFYELEQLLDKPYSNRLDSITPTSAFRLLAKAVLLLKKEFESGNS